MIEFELKFQVDAEERSKVEAAVQRGRSQRTRLRARYYDTADGALAAQRIVLRLRKEGRLWVQTAKAPGNSPLERLEDNFELPPVRGADVPRPLAGRHEGTPVGRLVAKALRQAGHDPETAEWVALYTTDVWRTTREMRSGDARIELAFDHGSVRAGQGLHPLCELEMELKQGHPASMLELARRWVGRYRLWLDTVSKAERGERLARGVQHAPAVKAQSPSFAEGADGAEIFRNVLASCLRQILPNASEIAGGSPDPEHVHQLRVGIRRLRTALREMAGLGGRIEPGWEPVLVEAFRELGRQRDREQLESGLLPQLEAIGAPAFSIALAAEDAADAATVVRNPALQCVLLELVAASLPEEPPAGLEATLAAPPSPSSSAARKILRTRLAKLQGQVLHDGERFEKLDPVAQHRVRKRLKRLRYLAEFVAPLFDAKGAKRFLEQLEPAQDVLGAHNDAAMAINACRERAEQDGGAWFAVGWLSARQPASAAECRRSLQQMAKAKAFWK